MSESADMVTTTTITKHWVIYALSEPGAADPLAPEAVRYVGFTSGPMSKRLCGHRSEALGTDPGRNSHKNRWLQKHITAGLWPVPHQILHSDVWAGTDLDEFDAVWTAAEKRWIAHYRALGARLTNATDGGDGFVGFVRTQEQVAKMRGKKRSAETIAKMSAAMRGKKLTPETRAKIGEAHRGRSHSPEWNAKVGAANRGRKLSPETISKLRGRAVSPQSREKMRRALLGRSLSPEHLAKTRAAAEARRGRKLTPEHIAKISAASRGRRYAPEVRARMGAPRGRKLTAEHVEKVAAANRGRKHTSEARAKMSAACKGRKMAPESIAKMAATKRGQRRSTEAVAKTAAANKGRKRTPEQCAKIGAAHRGKRLSDVHRAKLSEAHKGQRQSAETRAKRSASMRGKTLKPESVARLSATRSAQEQAKREALGRPDYRDVGLSVIAAFGDRPMSVEAIATATCRKRSATNGTCRRLALDGVLRRVKKGVYALAHAPDDDAPLTSTERLLQALESRAIHLGDIPNLIGLSVGGTMHVLANEMKRGTICRPRVGWYALAPQKHRV